MPNNWQTELDDIRRNAERILSVFSDQASDERIEQLLAQLTQWDESLLVFLTAHHQHLSDNDKQALRSLHSEINQAAQTELNDIRIALKSVGTGKKAVAAYTQKY